MILAIDTSAAQCAVALIGAGDPVAERQPMERGHAEHLFPMIESVLATAGATYSGLSRIAVCTGPGSFTGVRIGVAAARGLALGRGIPVIGISRFEAVAAEAGGPVAVCLAARGGAVYLQGFDADGAPLAPPRMVGEAALAASIPPGCARFAGDAAALMAGESALLPQGLPDPAIVARLAADRTPGPLPAPLYLRGADADPPREGPPRLLD
jgi:tRNA threonylcarbamoyl adenosine modification protein YeaZ